MMSVVVILVLLETVRFLIKDKSETLSSKYVCRTKPTPQNYKIFCSGQHSRGYCPANFQKQPVINTIAEKRVFLCTETDVSNALYEQENPENHLPGAGLPADGAVGEAELGASALAGIFYLMIFMLGFGFSIGAQILIARRNGAKEYSQIGPLFMQSTAFLLLMALVLFILSKVFAARIMGALIEAPDVREAAVRYLDYRVYGFFFAYVGSMFRAFYVGTTRTRILTINSIVMVLTNVVLNYLLIFGKFGFPEMGIAGAAIASSISEGVSALFYILYTRYRTDWRRYKFRFTGFDFPC